LRNAQLQALKGAGWPCAAIASSADLAGFKAGESPAIIFLDVKSAGPDGPKAIALARSLFHETALVLKADTINEALLLDWMRAGACDVLRKPVEPGPLVAAAERWAAREEARSADSVEAPSNQLLVSAIQTLVEVMEAKDSYSVGYARDVAALADKLGAALKLPAKSRQGLRLAAILHDVGRIALRDDIVNKRGELNPAEQQHMAMHVLVGERILRHLLRDSDVLLLVRHHHEWYNGKGYPDRLGGEEIPLGARVLTVADAFVAITQDRPHRPKRSTDEALREICVRAGNQFCPKVVGALLDVLGYRHSDPASPGPQAAGHSLQVGQAARAADAAHVSEAASSSPAAPLAGVVAEAVSENPPRETESPLVVDEAGHISEKEVLRRLKQAMDLRAMPNIVSEIIAMTSDEERNIDDVAAKITCDHALATKLLRLANSALYGSRTKVESIDRAVVKLGLDRVRQLVIGVSVIDQWQESQQSGRIERTEFWRHSISTALMAQRVCDLCGHEYHDAAFTAGLLHDVGQLVLQEALEDHYGHVLEKVRSGRLFLPLAERAHFGVDHASIMRTLGHEWNLSEELIEAIAWHHAPWEEVQKLSPRVLQFAMCIRVADILSCALGFGDAGLGNLEMVPETFLNFLGLKREAVEKILADIPHHVAQLGKTYGLADPEIPESTAGRKPPQRRGYYVSEGEATLDPVWQHLCSAGAEFSAQAKIEPWKQAVESSWCWVRVAGPAFTREIISSLQTVRGDAQASRQNLLLLLPASSPEPVQRLLAGAGIWFLVEPWSVAALRENLGRMRELKSQSEPAAAATKA
jgi:HD-GYP domain-containing protein (c-di-GMP phosphodiesterase class II)